MAAKKSKTAKKTAATGVDTDIARKIWLAGVGAYGRAFTEAQDAAGKLAASASEAFDQLVAQGEQVEDKVRDRIAKAPAGKKVAALVEDVSKKSKARRSALETRIGSVRKTLTETLAPYNLAALGEAVQALSKQVEALTEEVASLKAEKAAPKAAAAKAAPAKAEVEAA
ncbi:MAG: phasin family protein [Caulobacter sp.]|jgi:polyhydroxyalkanoate synthesis regulator phasin